MIVRVLAATIVFMGIAGPAEAYVGPGLGAGAIATALGIVGSIFLALFAVIYYPIKRFFKKKKGEKSTTNKETKN